MRILGVLEEFLTSKLWWSVQKYVWCWKKYFHWVWSLKPAGRQCFQMILLFTFIMLHSECFSQVWLFIIPHHGYHCWKQGPRISWRIIESQPRDVLAFWVSQTRLLYFWFLPSASWILESMNWHFLHRHELNFKFPKLNFDTAWVVSTQWMFSQILARFKKSHNWKPS